MNYIDVVVAMYGIRKEASLNKQAWVGQGTFNAFKNRLQNNGNTMAGIGQNAVNTAKSIGNRWMNMSRQNMQNYQNAGDTLRNMNRDTTVGELWDNVAMAPVNNAKNRINSNMQNIQDVYNFAAQTGKDVYNTMKTNWNNRVQGAQQDANEMQQQIQRGGQVAQSAINSGINTGKGIWNKMKAYGNQAGQAIANNVRSAQEGLGNAIYNTVYKPGDQRQAMLANQNLLMQQNNRILQNLRNMQ